MEDNGNGKVTMALLKQTQEQTNQLLREFIAEQRAFNKEVELRLRCDEIAAQARETRLTAVEENQTEHSEAIEGLKSSDRKWSAASVFASSIVGVITGWLKQ